MRGAGASTALPTDLEFPALNVGRAAPCQSKLGVGNTGVISFSSLADNEDRTMKHIGPAQAAGKRTFTSACIFCRTARGTPAAADVDVFTGLCCCAEV